MTTDLIVGFPGETDDDFERTMELAAAAEYDSAYTFMLLPRGPVPKPAEDEPISSSIRPSSLSDSTDSDGGRGASVAPRHEGRIGRVEEIVVEGPTRKATRSVLTGRTRQNKLVHFTPPPPLRIGTYAAVGMTRRAPHFLEGELVDFISEPTHKLRPQVTTL